MADAKMNAAWWKKNKALTLTDKGDTVLNALKAWDAAKTGKDFAKAEKALLNIAKAASDLKAKANKVLHKESIGYLNSYIANAKGGKEKLSKATGKDLLKNLHNLPKSMMGLLRTQDPDFWTTFQENVEFIAVMKGGKGSPKIYETYIKEGAKKQVNLPGKILKNVEAAIKGGVWDGEAWVKAFESIQQLVISSTLDTTAIEGCTYIEKNMILEGLQKI